MLKPDFITAEEWNTLLKYCTAYSVNPYLIIAIGLHETGWGELGWGKQGYILGVGCFNETQADISLQGFNTQISWATQALSKFFGLHPSEQELNEFAAKIWKPGDPAAWAVSVWSIYQKTLGQYAPEFKDFKDIPEWAREALNYLFAKHFLNTPYGSADFYRCMAVIYRVFKSNSQ